MGLGAFFRKQFVDVIQWTESEEGVLAYRYPMQDMEIQYGAKLTVRESQMALFVNEGKLADAFGPGLYTLETRTLPLLTNLMNWDKLFESPFKSDVYFFSTRVQTNQRWGTQNPVTVRDREFGAVRLRGFGVYSWHVSNPVTFHKKVSGTRDTYRVADIDGHLRNLVVARMSDTFAESNVPFLDMAANTMELGQRVAEHVRPAFEELGLTLDSFTVENLSLPDELQKRLDERIGMNMVGDLGRYTQFQAAQSIPIAAANEGGGAGLGAGLGAGMAMGQAMGRAMTDALGATVPSPPSPTPSPSPYPAPEPTPHPVPIPTPNPNPLPSPDEPAGAAAAAGATATKFCMHCGKSISRAAKFCPECGGKQE
jgi:membrane protease subunit (stomatin/prohibitin family)